MNADRILHSVGTALAAEPAFDAYSTDAVADIASACLLAAIDMSKSGAKDTGTFSALVTERLDGKVPPSVILAVTPRCMEIIAASLAVSRG